MALETQRTLPQLKAECAQKGIEVVIEGKKEHKEDYVKALRNYWLNKYYGSPENAPWALKFMLNEIDCPMLCKRFKQCKPEVQKRMLESDEYIAEEKVDGCFHYKTPVLLSDGTTQPIGEIVEKRLSVEVMSFDECTGKFVPRKVVGWFDNGYKKSSQWMKISNLGGKTSPFYNAYHQGVFITKNHNVWSDGEWKPAGEVSNVCVVNLGMNDTQIKVMYGSVLGDGTCSYSRKEEKKAHFQFTHSVKQKDYFNKKSTLFSPFPHRISVLTSGYGSEIHSFRLNACKDATLLRENHYFNNARKITQEYLNTMGILGLAIWYMDDGSRLKSRNELSCHSTNKFSRATFSAYRYNESDVREIVTWLNSFGYESSAHMTTRKGKNLGYVIQLSSQGSQKFFRDIALYIPESMEYKLPENYRGGIKESWWECNTPEYTFITTEVSWKLFNSNRDKNITSTKAYDIEVEGCHSYVANGIIVHNSRSLILFDASTQSFDFYSRNNSVKDFLPQSYKDTVLVTSKGFTYTENFVLDCEVISTNPNISTVMGKRGVVCATQLQATTALLALNPEDSKSLQRKDPLKFIIFDCLYDGESLINKPWKERHPHAEKLASLLKQSGFTCDINPVVRENKLEFYSDLIEQGREGIILKRVDASYHGCTSRTDDQVKLKRTVAEGLNKDLDAWVTGFIPSTQDKGWSNYIGALVFSCKVQMKDGTIKDHVIGVCSGIPFELRKAATIYIDDKPSLNPDFLGRVATLSGQNISARKLALTHAVIQCWRPDKDPDGCEILTEEELLSLVF